MNKAGLKSHMVNLINSGYITRDMYTGEINATEMAEMTAYDLGHSEWLDDETHVVWDAALDVAWAYRP